MQGGLDWYDHGARLYDPAVGRWMVMDPAGQFSYRHKSGFGVGYSNDGHPFHKFGYGDGGDGFRSSAVSVSYKDLSIGMRIFTGDRDYDAVEGYGIGGSKEGWVSNPEAYQYMSSQLFIGYKNMKLGV